MIKGQIAVILQALQLFILTTAAVFNYLNLRDIRKQVDTYMDTMSTRTTMSEDVYPIYRCEHFHFLDPQEPHVTPLVAKE